MRIFSELQDERRFEILGVLMLALSILLFLALAPDPYGHATMGDSGERWLTGTETPHNVLGKPGAIIAMSLYVVMGHASHVIYFLIALWGIMLLRHKPLDRLITRGIGFAIICWSVAAFLHINFAKLPSGTPPGGALGFWAGKFLEAQFGALGANIIALATTTIGTLLATEFLFVHLLHWSCSVTILMVKTLGQYYQATTAWWNEYQTKRAQALEAAKPEKTAKKARSDRYRKRGKKRPPLELDTEEARADVEAEATAAEERDLSRIRIRPEPVPEAADPAAQPPPAEEAPQEPTEAAQMELPEPKAVAEELGDTVDSGENPTPEPEPVSVEAPKPKKPVMPRRKMSAEEELPEDYEYPKRYTKPSIDLFEKGVVVHHPNLGDELRQTCLLLEETLKTFNIDAEVTDVTRGPTITRFELEPAPGIKVSRFLALADDLALALKAHRVRVEAPIPGKGRVGIEVPNADRESVVIRELLESRSFKNKKNKLGLALGKNIAGDVTCADLATMPHLLVAGATGAGKTVCVKTLLASLLCTNTPDELQLMLIDPKMVELSIFNDIPHLMTPVVIDPKKAAASLNWLITEMEERYRLFAHLRVRNIEVYNESVDNGEIEMPSETEGEAGESVDVIRKLPYIVCIIDELADLMMLARSEVEDSIGRLAQLARAVGIHLIIATQRPSVDVLTGVIKANFPARMSFQVSSRVDSRCILDEIGAEKLIGMGDMLYLPAGQSKPTRIQGAFVSDEEMNSLIAYLKTQAPPQYRDEIEKHGKGKGAGEDLCDESDELLDDAINVVLETGQASISMVQRRLRVGYTRAARLIDMMEMKGIIGPHVGSKAREILVDAPPEDEVA